LLPGQHCFLGPALRRSENDKIEKRKVGKTQQHTTERQIRTGVYILEITLFLCRGKYHPMTSREKILKGGREKRRKRLKKRKMLNKNETRQKVKEEIEVKW
jgi:hypothetical protein